MNFNINDLQWTREPEDYFISDGKIEIVTKPFTDLWQRTYYHFRNDNAPVLQMKTDEKFFSFMVKTEFESKHRFDQCGIVMYLAVCFVNITEKFTFPTPMITALCMLWIPMKLM